ncbi:cyclic-phosphate processing receiver domain-containing protein [Pseudalkalibacillus sp. SCS-8]|uniref:cyclic-phosphate processing receiver domain-containing protein n=1 Tax=Pseudalkalibacillus nanhaiensis TaxID=3115291 RepID=UPI0032D9DCE2
MSKINVFLDDVRPCPDDYFLASDMEECIQFLRRGNIKHLSLDHDLENKARNGFMVVEYMVRHKLFAETITVHSANAGAGKKMFYYLKDAQEQFIIPQTVEIYYHPLPLNIYKR